MEKTVIYCDVCRKPEARVYEFEVDRELDGAGDTDTVSRRVDLCRECGAGQLELFILSLPWKARLTLYEGIAKAKRLYLSGMTRQERVYGFDPDISRRG